MVHEKLEFYGVNSLSDSELLQVLGVSEEKAGNINLNSLDRLTLQRAGLTPKQINKVLAALALSKRTQKPERVKITSSRTSNEVLLPFLSGLEVEKFYCIYLNRGNVVQGVREISSGGVSATVVDVRVILSYAIEYKSSAIILAHNHPSGNLQPSQADFQITKKVSEAGKFLDIVTLDHLIITTDNGYYSFADNDNI